MAEVYVSRHAPKDNVTGELTEEGRQKAIGLKVKLGQFDRVIASDLPRAQETAQLLTDRTPEVDDRAGFIMASPEVSNQLNEQALTHPYGFAGALLDNPALRGMTEIQAEKLINLIEEELAKLSEGQRSLIVSHDITMVPAWNKLNNKPVETHGSFEYLSGFKIDQDKNISEFRVDEI